MNDLNLKPRQAVDIYVHTNPQYDIVDFWQFNYLLMFKYYKSLWNLACFNLSMIVVPSCFKRVSFCYIKCYSTTINL